LRIAEGLIEGRPDRRAAFLLTNGWLIRESAAGRMQSTELSPPAARIKKI